MSVNQGGVSLDVVSCGFPRALLLLHKRHRLDRRVLVCEAGVELHHHIVTIGRTWHGLGVLHLLELARQPLSQRCADALQRRDSRLFRDDSLKIGGSLAPTSGVIACIYMPQPGLSRCRGTFFEVVLGMDSATTQSEAEHQHTQSAHSFQALWYSPECKTIVLSTTYVNISMF